MKSAVLLSKIILIVFVSAAYLTPCALAETPWPAREQLPSFSLAEGFLAGLEIDHMSLSATSLVSGDREYYAMATGSTGGQSTATLQRNSGLGLQRWHKYLGYGTV